MNRIAGLETEYGCLSQDPSGPPSVVGRVRNWIFDQGRYGVADTLQRDWDEPAGNGGFLFNGGRAYVDMGHLEYCTPECRTVADVLRYDRAGDLILLRALRELRMQHQASFIRNNIDHYSGATFGCHENYLVRRTAPFGEPNVLSLLGFLTLRILFTGAGRVGCSAGAEMRAESSSAAFQICQRADYITNDLFEWVQFNRAIINTRDEPLADARRFRRLHLLHGDTNVLPSALALKVGTTALVLDLLEIDRLPKVALADAVGTYRSMSYRLTPPWSVVMAGGSTADAVELLWKYHEAASRQFAGRDEETDAVLSLWAEALQGLSGNSSSLVGVVDWVTKRWLLEQFIERESLDWSDPWLKSIDLEYHQLDADKSLALPTARSPHIFRFEDRELECATRQPPADTRAWARSNIMQLFEREQVRYFVDWEVIDAEGVNSLGLLDPFDAAPVEVDPWVKAVFAARSRPS